MTNAERAYFEMCISMWQWGLELALQRAGFASVLMGGTGEETAFAPYLTAPPAADNVTMH